MSYLDTSVIVAALDPEDPRRDSARKILEKEENKIVSELVLAELSSIFARRMEIVSSLADKIELSGEEAIIALLIYILRRFNIKYRTVGGISKYPLLGEIYKPTATAIELSTRARLRTLDLLHLAYAKLLKDEGEHVSRIITMDNDFDTVRGIAKEVAGLDIEIVV